MRKLCLIDVFIQDKWVWEFVDVIYFNFWKYLKDFKLKVRLCQCGMGWGLREFDIGFEGYLLWKMNGFREKKLII